MTLPANLNFVRFISVKVLYFRRQSRRPSMGSANAPSPCRDIQSMLFSVQFSKSVNFARDIVVFKLVTVQRRNWHSVRTLWSSLQSSNVQSAKTQSEKSQS